MAAIRDAFHDWSFDREQIRPAVAPTIPHHCSDAFILGCAALARDFDVGLHSHVAESKVQAVAAITVYGGTQTAHLDRLGVHRAAFHGGARRLARPRGHGAAWRPRRLGRAQSRQQHAARLGPRRHQGDARPGRQCRDRHRRRVVFRQPEHLRGDAAGLVRLEGAGPGVAALADDTRGGAGRHRGQRPRARLRRPDRPHRAGLEGRSGAARPRPPELAAAQQPGQSAGPLRGRHRGRRRDDRRPDGCRESPRADRRSRRGCATGPRRRATGCKRRMPTTAACTRRSCRWSAAIARVSPLRPTTCTATARAWSRAARRRHRLPVLRIAIASGTFACESEPQADWMA